MIFLSSSLLLDGERWKQVDVPAEIQEIVSTLEAGKPLSITVWKDCHEQKLFNITGLPIPGSGSDRTLTPDSQAHLQPPRNKLTVHGQSFAVVGCVRSLVGL